MPSLERIPATADDLAAALALLSRMLDPELLNQWQPRSMRPSPNCSPTPFEITSAKPAALACPPPAK
ncbi:MAG TPA: hypothetical protein VGI99_02395 [Gemmataceae bacterium]